VLQNHDARLKQVENIISRLGTFGKVWAQKGIIWHFWAVLDRFGAIRALFGMF
jgi:hypothetical protein